MHGIYSHVCILPWEDIVVGKKGGPPQLFSISVSSPFSRSSQPRAELMEKARSRHLSLWVVFGAKKEGLAQLSVQNSPKHLKMAKQNKWGRREKSSLPQKVLFCLGPLSPSSKMHENTTCVFLHLWGWREWLLQKRLSTNEKIAKREALACS